MGAFFADRSCALLNLLGRYFSGVKLMVYFPQLKREVLNTDGLYFRNRLVKLPKNHEFSDYNYHARNNLFVLCVLSLITNVI